MVHLINPQTQHRGRGQALVEFTLTALLFLLMLVMVLEVARILAAYVTLQHAARQAARYAVTGNWETNYQATPSGHYIAGSDDPYARIAPCWPLFQDDPVIPDGANEEPAGPDFYQPFRNARTCSVEEAALKGLTGLALNPNAAPDEGNYYIIRVSGYSTDRYPETGTFSRNGTSGILYSNYFTLPEHVGANAGLAPGFAGEPNQKVVVQIYYRLPIITPLLSSIVPSLTLTGSAVMTNESFGSTSLQREAVQPPNLPAIPPVGPPSPPDLTIPTFTTTWNLATAVNASDDIDFTIDISNIGDMNSDAGTGNLFDVKIYETSDDVDPATIGSGGTTPAALGWTPITNGEWIDEAALIAGATRTLTVTNAHLSIPGVVYVYAWVDSENEIDEIGVGGGANPNGELNNVAKIGPFIFGSAVDLSVSATASGTPSGITPQNGGLVTYTVDVGNAGPADATAVEVQIDFPAGLDATPAGFSFPSCSGVMPTFVCGLPTITAGTSAPSYTFDLQMNSGADNLEVTTTFQVTDTSGVTIIYPADDTDSVTVYMGGTNLDVSKTVSDATTNVNDIITYTVTVENTGLNQATNIEILDTLPGEVSYQSDDSGGTYNSGSGIWSIATLDAGNTATLNIVAQVDVAGSGIVNTATLTAVDQPDTNGSDDSASVTITSEEVDVGINKTVDDTENYADGTVTYTIEATNNSITTTATNIVIVDTLPSGVTYDSHFPITGVSVSGNTVTWTIASLNPGNSTSLDIDAIVDSGAADGTAISNTATLTSLDQADTVAGNDSDSASFTVDNRTDLGMSVATTVNGVSGTTASEGDTVVFTWTITNNGPMDATDLSVTVDDILELANWSSIIVQDEGGNVLDLSTSPNLGDLAAGDSMNITVTAVVGTLAADTTDTFAATISAATPDDLDDPGVSTDPEDDSVTMTLLMPLLIADFEAGNDGFVYTAESAFEGVIGGASHNSNASYMSGANVAGGNPGNTLRLHLGDTDFSTISDMSAGYEYTFTLSTARNVTLTFDYAFEFSGGLDGGENGYVLVSLDDVLVGSDVSGSVQYQAGISSSNADALSPVWQTITIDLGTLAAGNHTLAIGGYLTNKNRSDEEIFIWYDNVTLKAN